MSRPMRMRRGGWVNERWRHRAAQVSRAADQVWAIADFGDYREVMDEQPERYGLLDPDEVFAEGVPGLTPIGRYAEPCLIPESDDPAARDCPLCGIRHRFTVECWGGGGSGVRQP